MKLAIEFMGTALSCGVGAAFWMVWRLREVVE